MTVRALFTAGAVAILLAMPASAAPFRVIVTDMETPLVPNSVMELAEREGYFDRAGVEVEFVRVQQTPLAIAALRSGEGEMANVGVEALLQLRLQGVSDIRAVTSPNKALPYMIVASGLNTVPELAGKAFGIGRIGSVDHLLSVRVLAANGVNPATVELVPLGQPNVRAQALVAGRIAATTMSIGTFLSIPEADRLSVLVGVEDFYAAAPVVSKVNAVTTAVLEQRGEEVEAVIEALTLAARDFAADPSAWVAAMEKARPDVSHETLVKLGQAFAQSWSVNGGLEKAELDSTVDWLWETEDFAGKPRPAMESWVDFGPEDAVLSRIGVAEGQDRPSR
ncbi:ABC transporter substrate-binding protein [Haematobacter massiliensis]|uniref:ABC transporter substrate-binding protein n=1 Tax=Haematobacter massiliensis TaxID=195105 RepID=UPI000557A6C1|nr:ABC transporter substrate-binding protein [Haematobacter massiliensis]OWJ70003.1 ABC transporter substrate-binding protein [Haematobacter massiliensis]OWJ87111.1 ABC transporter substrate-binding protein [Haematobacter massiliensis]QBJ23100.1 ABC transporter substrate-binding protein [Haematobacter massiliensis]